MCKTGVGVWIMCGVPEVGNKLNQLEYYEIIDFDSIDDT